MRVDVLVNFRNQLATDAKVWIEVYLRMLFTYPPAYLTLFLTTKPPNLPTQTNLSPRLFLITHPPTHPPTQSTQSLESHQLFAAPVDILLKAGSGDKTKMRFWDAARYVRGQVVKYLDEPHQVCMSLSPTFSTHLLHSVIEVYIPFHLPTHPPSPPTHPPTQIHLFHPK